MEHRSGRRFGICHAQCPVADWGDIAAVARDEQLQQEMLWARSGNALFIETGIYRPGGRLTLLSLDEI